MPPSEAVGSGHRIVGVTARSGEEVVFDPPRAFQRVGGERQAGVPAARVERDTLYATVDGRPYRIALQDARELWFDDRRTSWTGTALLVGGVIGGFWLFVTAAFYWG